jgi:hypothetical protein
VNRMDSRLPHEVHCAFVKLPQCDGPATTARKHAGSSPLVYERRRRYV